MLSQLEADNLIAMPKRFVSTSPVAIPPGVDETHDLIGNDNREKFLLDVWRGTLRLTKVKLQNRAKTIYMLVRLDIDGSPHTNPDGKTVAGTHLHRYREGFGDKWAIPVDGTIFSNTSNLRVTFEQFLQYCNILEAPPFQEYIL